MGNAINMVPIEEPVAVDTIQVARKVKAVKNPPWMPMVLAIQTKPPDRPQVLMSWLNIPTRSRIMTTETEVMEEIPLITLSQKAL